LKTFSTLNLDADPPPNPSKKPLEPQLLGYDAVVVVVVVKVQFPMPFPWFEREKGKERAHVTPTLM
jgi:hypothetical protein